MKLRSRILAMIIAVVMLAALPMPAMAYSSDPDRISPRHVSLFHDDSNVSGKTLTVTRNNSISLEAYLYPEDASVYTDISWYSEDSNIASVNDHGGVTAHEPGYVKITAESGNGYRNSVTIFVPGVITNGSDRYVAESPSSSSTASSRASTASSGTSLSKTTIKLTKKVDRASLVNQIKAAGGKKVTLSNYTSISASTLKAAADAGKSLINFDTKSGKSYAGRLIINPATLSSKVTGDLKVGVYTGVANTSTVQNYFDSNFYNNCRVILCDQKSFPANVEIVVPIGKMSSTGLRFYTYDTSTKKYTEFKPSKSTKDSSNFLHITTNKGGYIIISDGGLRAI